MKNCCQPAGSPEQLNEFAQRGIASGVLLQQLNDEQARNEQQMSNRHARLNIYQTNFT